MRVRVPATILASGLAALLASGEVRAEFPEQDFQGVIMWGAGGATDNVARAITPLVEPHLGQKIVLVNRPGGTGAIATQFVSARPADGYTLLYGAETRSCTACSASRSSITATSSRSTSLRAAWR